MNIKHRFMIREFLLTCLSVGFSLVNQMADRKETFVSSKRNMTNQRMAERASDGMPNKGWCCRVLMWVRQNALRHKQIPLPFRTSKVSSIAFQHIFQEREGDFVNREKFNRLRKRHQKSSQESLFERDHFSVCLRKQIS